MPEKKVGRPRGRSKIRKTMWINKEIWGDVLEEATERDVPYINVVEERLRRRAPRLKSPKFKT